MHVEPGDELVTLSMWMVSFEKQLGYYLLRKKEWTESQLSLVLHSAKTNLLADSMVARSSNSLMVEKQEVYHLLLIGTYMNRLPGFCKSPTLQAS